MKARFALFALALLVVAPVMAAEPVTESDLGEVPGGTNFASPCPGPTTFNGNFGSPQAGKNIGTGITTRLFRNGVPSVCPGPKACPGNLNTSPFTQEVWPFTGDTVARCYTVTFNGGSCGSGFQVHPSVWCGTYPENTSIPANCTVPGTAFLGDSGSSPAANANVVFNFCTNAGQDWSLLVGRNYSGGACTYSFTVSCGAACTQSATCASQPGGGGGGTCNLQPIEAKLDRIEPAVNRLEPKLDAIPGTITRLEGKLDAIPPTISAIRAAQVVMEAKIDRLNLEPLPCQIYRLLNSRLPGKPDAVGSKCLGLLPTTCANGKTCVELP